MNTASKLWSYNCTASAGISCAICEHEIKLKLKTLYLNFINYMPNMLSYPTVVETHGPQLNSTIVSLIIMYNKIDMPPV